MDAMNQIHKSNDFDLEAIRKRIAEETGTVRELNAPPAEEKIELNPFARQIAEQFRETSYTPNLITGQLRLLEFVALFAIGLGFHFHFNPQENLFSPLSMLTLLFGSGVSVILFQLTDSYEVQSLRAPLRSLPKVMSGWALAFVLMALALFLLKSGQDYSRLWFVTWFFSGAAYLLAERNLVSYGIRHWARDGTMERRAVIIGGVGYLYGGVVGAAVLLLLEESLVGVTEHWHIILGLLLLAVVLFAPKGVAALFGKRHG